jgi:hypothetical protein
LQVRLQRRIRFQITTGPGGLRLGPSGAGAAISCMYWEMRNMDFLAEGYAVFNGSGPVDALT